MLYHVARSIPYGSLCIDSGGLVLRDNCPVDRETDREDGGVHLGKAKRADRAMTVPRYRGLSFGTKLSRPVP